jgi:hypothetical protein
LLPGVDAAGDVGGRANANLKRGRDAERQSQRSWEHFEVEAKAMRAVAPRFRSREVVVSGNPRGPSRKRQKVEEGAGKANVLLLKRR